MQLYVPDIGDTLTLTEDWVFKYNTSEHRNHLDLSKFREGSWEKEEPRPGGYANWSQKHVNARIPKGSVLKVDRIYIRKGATGFSSITFYLVSVPGEKKMKKQRFWASLTECNKIVFEHGGQKGDNVSIQWDYTSIFKGKEDLRNRSSLYSTSGNLEGVFESRSGKGDDFRHSSTWGRTMSGTIDGKKIPYKLTSSVETRKLNEEEILIAMDSYRYKNYASGILNVLSRAKQRENWLDSLWLVHDWSIDILDENDNVVKSYKTVTSAKKWVKDTLNSES